MTGDAPVDPLVAFAESFRARGDLEVRSGVLQGTRVDYFRGKDLVRLAQSSPAALRDALPASRRPPAEADAADLAAAVGSALLARGLVVRCARASRKPIPGTNGKLVKFPKRLVPDPAGAGAGAGSGSGALAFASKDAFYALTFEPRSSVGWTALVAVLVAAAVIGVCLFPLAPNGVKLAAFNASLGLLLAILGVVVLRALLALLSWIALGRALWFLPLLLDDAKPLAEVFSPLWAWEEPADPNHWSHTAPVRLLVALSLAGAVRQLANRAPAGRAVVANAMRYRDEMLEFLSLDLKRIDDDNQRETRDGGETGGAHQERSDPNEEDPDGENEHEDDPPTNDDE